MPDKYKFPDWVEGSIVQGKIQIDDERSNVEPVMSYQRLFDDDGICVHPDAQAILNDFVAKFDAACGTMGLNPRELAWAVSETLMANASDKIRRARNRRDESHI